MTKILFFCSPIGLGHATRDLAIINQMELESCKIFSVIGVTEPVMNAAFYGPHTLITTLANIIIYRRP